MGKKVSRKLIYEAKFDGDILKYNTRLIPKRLLKVFGFGVSYEFPLNIALEFKRDNYFVFSCFTVHLYIHQFSKASFKTRRVKIWLLRWDKFNKVLTDALLDILWLNLNHQNIGVSSAQERASEIALRQLQFHLSSKSLKSEESDQNQTEPIEVRPVFQSINRQIA